MGSDGWPVTLRHGPITLRPLRQRDRDAWWEVRRRNAAWLQPWDATDPVADEHSFATFRQRVWLLRGHARAGRAMPFAVDVDGVFSGELTVSSIVHGAARSASLGYWIDRSRAGRGIMPTAVAMVCDHLFTSVRLHRIEIAIRPENTASLRVVEKLQFTDYGYAPKYLHIAGQWADHRLFQLLAEDRPTGVLSHYLATLRSDRGSGEST